ncbi:MAG: thioredoxin family protein [Gammaproteobacteria bacterium]|nr:thioredoxin family protein [Gammaproteobacteria bacterium]MCW5583192.1 thioredoxin family protein [Gammaproteobacteria bacterium]
MAETPSNMLPLNTLAPDFRLMDTRSHQYLSLQDIKSPVATVIMFICNHCPYVKHIQAKLVEVANLYQEKKISFIAINSNDVSKYPDDSPENMHLEAEKHHYSFPYLYDETQEVAKTYQAACTPDFYLFDKNLRCVYRGRFDDSTPGNQHPVTGKDLCQAIDNVLSGKPVSSEQKASVGCNIKWKKPSAS